MAIIHAQQGRLGPIDLNRIATFVRVVDTGSFTAAAALLGLPTSSVSRAVARLEQDLGVRLLNRTTRKLVLTDAGQHFHVRMQAVIGETEEATQAVSGFATEPRGVVRLTAPHDLALRQLPALISKLTLRHPGVVVELLLTSRKVDLIEEGIDLALRGGRLDDSSLVARKIFSSTLGIFATPAYLQRRGRPRKLTDLTSHDCLTFGGRGGRMPWRLQGPAGEETVIVSSSVVCADMLFLREMALLDAGLALLPAESVTAEVAAGTLVRVLPRHGFEGGGLFVVWPSRTLVPARVVAVRDFLIEELTLLRLDGARR